MPHVSIVSTCPFFTYIPHATFAALLNVSKSHAGGIQPFPTHCRGILGALKLTAYVGSIHACTGVLLPCALSHALCAWRISIRKGEYDLAHCVVLS